MSLKGNFFVCYECLKDVSQTSLLFILDVYIYFSVMVSDNVFLGHVYGLVKIVVDMFSIFIGLCTLYVCQKDVLVALLNYSLCYK